MDRTERQKVCVKRWLKANGAATIVAATGFGKTNIALNIAEILIKKNPDASILIVVPTEPLKEQWESQLADRALSENCNVQIINSVIKKKWDCDLLIVDECHLMAATTFSLVFTCVTYRLILCLTGTMERLDGKEVIIKQFAPVCDTITLQEAEANGWVSPVKEYAVMLKVDLTEYEELNKKFNSYFAYFDWIFSDAMLCATNAAFRRKYAKSHNLDWRQVTAMAMDWMRCLRKRKEFVMSHPKKLEIAKKILEARQDKKCITFSATIKDAESLGVGYTLHSKQSKKKNDETLKAFNEAETGVLNSSKACDQGIDVKGLSVGIILATDSSKIRKTQRTGRVCRFEPGKKAEMFTLLIEGTQEVNWFRNSSTSKYTTINEEQLEKILAGEEINSRQIETTNMLDYRF